MEAIEALLKTAQSPVIAILLAWILWFMRQDERQKKEFKQERDRLELALERERVKNERLIEITKDVIQNGNRATASALKQIKRMIDPRNLDETGEFNASDFPRIS